MHTRSPLFEEVTYDKKEVDNMGKRVFFLVKNGATPTDSSVKKILKEAYDELDADNFKTFSGTRLNNPEYLRNKLRLTSAVVQIDIDNHHFNVIDGRDEIKNFKTALKAANGLSSWEVAQAI